MTLHLVIDCETTGLFDYTKPADAGGQPRLCQIGMIWLDEDFSTVKESEYLIKPTDWKLTEEAAAINGLTQELLEAEGVHVNGPLREYAEAIDKKHVIVGFNAPYDVKLMRAELRHARMEDRFMQTRTLCVMRGCKDMVGARTESGRKKMPTLVEACNYFGIDREPVPHRALGGARATLEILRYMRDSGMMPAYDDPYDKTKYR
jgi:DNA polymerase III subunit epsilon